MKTQEELNKREMVQALFGVSDSVLAVEEKPEPKKEFVSIELDRVEACPICDNQVRKEYEDYLEHTLSEYRYTCDLCGLTSMYAYGLYETNIEEFRWGYTHDSKPTKEEAEQERKEQEFVAALFRKMVVHKQDLTEREDRSLIILAEKMERRFNGEPDEPASSCS